MGKILLIDDDALFRAWLAQALLAKGYEVKCAVNGREGLECIRQFCPDIIMLDVVMPQMDGFELLSARECATPVMMFSARNNEQERIKGYELGADDFLHKPFSIKELLVRLHALERRLRTQAQPNNPLEFTFESKLEPNLGHSLSFDETTYRLLVIMDGAVGAEGTVAADIANLSVELTQTEFRLCHYLYERNGQVISKQELQWAVLQKELGKFDRNLDMHVSNIRRKFTKLNLPRNLINTVRGQGYHFTL
ncbi:MAG: response regulator transcription factor [Shewanella sp.]